MPRQLIEQAIFTSARTKSAAGYHLVAASGGLSVDDRQLLSTIAPAHDALAPGREELGSFSYWPFVGERYCLAESRLAGPEYSGRGERLYTSLFLVPQEIWERFAGNPFAIRRALRAKGLLRIRDPLPEHLSALALPGRVSEGYAQSLLALKSIIDEGTILRLTEQLISGNGIVFTGLPDNDKVVEGIFQSFPFARRAELSFSTGLRYAACRPTRIICGEVIDAQLKSLERERKYLRFEANAQFASTGT